MMANFQKAWAFTRTWEGPFDDRGNDNGHFFPRAKSDLRYFNWAKDYTRKRMGTTFGLTPQFLFDYVVGYQQPTLPTADTMKDMTEDTAKGIWQKTAWIWMRGDDIKDQSLATILFDWTVKENGRCMVQAPTLLKLKKAAACFGQTYVELGTRTKADHKDQGTQKVYLFNDLFIEKINQHPNPKALFGQFWAKMTNHAERRHNALKYDNMVFNTMPVTKSRLTAEKPQNTEGSQWTTIMLTLVGGYIGGKIFKWW